MAYDPSLPPTSPQALGVWGYQELSRLASELRGTAAIYLRPIAAEPAKMRDGMLIYADGTNFDPGSGEGIYARVNGTWVKLHA